MADKTTTNFPKMGTSAATSVEDLSGQPSSYTKPVKRKGASSDRDPSIGTKKNRRGIQERLGAKNKPQADILYPNTPEHSQTLGNTYMVATRTGLGDFWNKRTQAPEGRPC